MMIFIFAKQNVFIMPLPISNIMKINFNIGHIIREGGREREKDSIKLRKTICNIRIMAELSCKSKRRPNIYPLVLLQ